LIFRRMLRQERKRYISLEWGKTADRPKPAYEVKITEDVKVINVDTGVLQFLVRKDKFRIMEAVKVNGKRDP